MVQRLWTDISCVFIDCSQLPDSKKSNKERERWRIERNKPLFPIWFDVVTYMKMFPPPKLSQEAKNPLRNSETKPVFWPDETGTTLSSCEFVGQKRCWLVKHGRNDNCNLCTTSFTKQGNTERHLFIRERGSCDERTKRVKKTKKNDLLNMSRVSSVMLDLNLIFTVLHTQTGWMCTKRLFSSCV